MMPKQLPSLSLYAGPRAIQTIKEKGLTPDMIKVIAGASGGPKWFVLNGLDRFIFGEWLKDINHSIHLLGSSAGSWRFSCFAQHNPMQAYDRFEEAYRDTCYAKNATPQDIQRQAETILRYILGEDGVQQILNNENFHSNIMAVRSRPLTRSDQKHALMAGLSVSFLANLAHRKSLGLFYERAFFHSPKARAPFYDLNDFPTQHIKLTHENVEKALIASGAIPLVVAAVSNIPGAKPGMYRDGGVLDYNFDLPFLKQEGLVLYPHFTSRMVPGWFDKSLTWRNPSHSHLDNVILLCPSDEFVSTLKYGKIPDRKDFDQLNNNDRIDFWNSVIKETRRLGDDFHELVSKENAWEYFKPLYQDQAS